MTSLVEVITVFTSKDITYVVMVKPDKVNQ